MAITGEFSQTFAKTMPEAASESMDSENTVTHYHKVVAGETLSSIARKRNTTIDQICRMNHISKNVKVRPGQILRYN